MISARAITKKEWDVFGETLHQSVFNWFRSRDDDKCDYAIIIEKDSHVAGFITVRELGVKRAHLLFGGVIPSFRGTLNTVLTYSTILDNLAKCYDTCTTCIENTNNDMLRISLKLGYKIIGIKTIDGCSFVELEMDLTQWK